MEGGGWEAEDGSIRPVLLSCGAARLAAKGTEMP